ncbi:MAG: hypothetical protein IGS39_00770 [Calothrix sp. C42_A2020_038]|nr:hypothetical protein [Calothrix sp. C42_A2020_038]
MQRLNSSEFASKVDIIANLFKLAFPETWVDLKPNLNESSTLRKNYLDSIDIAIHFPGKSILCQCSIIIVHIRFYVHPDYEKPYFTAIEAAGYDDTLLMWVYSGVDCSRFYGVQEPMTSGQSKLKYVFNQIFDIFARV